MVCPAMRSQATDRTVASLAVFEGAEDDRGRLVEAIVPFGVQVEQHGLFAEVCREDVGGDGHEAWCVGEVARW